MDAGRLKSAGFDFVVFVVVGDARPNVSRTKAHFAVNCTDRVTGPHVKGKALAPEKREVLNWHDILVPSAGNAGVKG
jgi:hypothetical protein